MKYFVLFLLSIATLLAVDVRPFIGVDGVYNYSSHSFDSDVGSTSGTSWVPELGARVGITLNKNHRVYVNYRYQFAHKLQLDLPQSGTMVIPGTAIYRCVVNGVSFGSANNGICTIPTSATTSENVAFGGTVSKYYITYAGTGYTYNGNYTVNQGEITSYTPDTSYTYTAANFNIETNIALHKFVLGYDYLFDNNVYVGILGGVGKATGDATITFTSTDITFAAVEDISYIATIVGANIGYQYSFNDNSKLNIGIKGEYITAGNQTINVQANDLSHNVKEYSFKPTEYNVGLYFSYNFAFGSNDKPVKTKTRTIRKK